MTTMYNKNDNLEILEDLLDELHIQLSAMDFLVKLLVKNSSDKEELLNILYKRYLYLLFNLKRLKSLFIEYEDELGYYYKKKLQFLIKELEDFINSPLIQKISSFRKS